jgi:3-deoxy-D-manno-octulosonate 8-phosphate phosphatase (KDO 8-P phosphatase)
MNKEVERTELLQRAANIKLAIFDVDGVLTDGQLYYSETGSETKAFCVQDGFGLKYIMQAGITVAVITGRESPMVAHRMAELGIDHVYQGRSDKRETFDGLVAALKLSNEETAYTGDDLIDLPLLKRAGLAVTVPNAHPLIRPYAHWITERSGGFGAVRDVCDLLLEARGKLQALLDQ